MTTAKIFGIKPIRTSFKSPWQNGIAERFVGNCRRDLLDHVIVLNERHLKRLMSEYVRYYHDDRTHLGLEKQTPASATCANGDSGACEGSLHTAARRSASSLRRRSLSSSSEPLFVELRIDGGKVRPQTPRR